LLVDLAISMLVDEFTNRFEIRFPICNIRFNKMEHLLDRPCCLDKHTIVDLQELEKLQDFLGVGCNLIDTMNMNYKVYLWLIRNIEITGRLCSSF
jgi:hypothetical protein